MTHTLVPLDSFRLARYAIPVSCIICAEENAFDSDRCRRCQAPMALTFQCAGQKAAPKMVAALAPPKAGKTVYLGMLTDLLSRQHHDWHLTARGAFSVSLQQTAISHLAQGWFPPPTGTDPSGWNWVHCRISNSQRRRPLEIVLPDVSGVPLCEEVERPHSQPMVYTMVRKCSVAMVLLDAARLVDGDRDPDFFAMKAVSYLCELDGRSRQGWPQRPFAFVFTKADTCEWCFSDPAGFAARYAPGLAKQAAERLRRYAFFGTCVAGGVAHQCTSRGRRSFPLRVEPQGVTEPFEWLLRQM
jgi:hypothetical protein